MSAFITVLYEDQLAAKPTNYGPHILLLACVGDACGDDRWTLQQRVRGIPKKGDAKLRAIPAKKPTPEERDRILHAAASDGRAVRDAILRAVPSFARLVHIVRERLAPRDP